MRFRVVFFSGCVTATLCIASQNTNIEMNISLNLIFISTQHQLTHVQTVHLLSKDFKVANFQMHGLSNHAKMIFIKLFFYHLVNQNTKCCSVVIIEEKGSD